MDLGDVGMSGGNFACQQIHEGVFSDKGEFFLSERKGLKLLASHRSWKRLHSSVASRRQEGVNIQNRLGGYYQD